MSKQQSCQKFIFKIHSNRLRRARWNLTLPVDEARKNDEIISLADSQVMSWLDELNGIEGLDDKVKELRSRISEIRNKPNTVQSRRELRRLYRELDELQFKPDYMCLIIDKDKDYRRACRGFMINGTRYKRLLGTVGGVKNSTIVFCSERHINEIKKRLDNGRNLEKEMVTAKLGAYMALACSASVPVSFPKGILVVNDVETTFKSDIISLAGREVGEPLMEYKADQDITIDATDGFGLALPSLAQRWSEDLGLDYIMAGCCSRFAFEKGMIFTFDFLDFADKIAGQKYIVKDAWGNDVDIRDVELILTTSMVKLWDSYNSCEEYVKHSLDNKYSFRITKNCPEKLESQRGLNYQFIQSYQLDDEDIDKLVKPTIDEMDDVLNFDWRKSVVFLKGIGLTEKNIDKVENDFAKAMMIEPRILDDPFVQNSIYQLIKNRINKAKVGVLKIHGNYSVVSGDPYLLCQSIFGLELTGLLKAGEIYNKYWADQDSDKLACFRAPMTCHNNIRLVTPCKCEEAHYWYKYMNTCTIFNAWDTAMAALNGLDFDGDLVMLTDNEVLVNKLTELPAIMCEQKKAVKRISSEEDFVESDIASFGNDIGQITNWITSMFEVRAGFKEDSREYEMLSYRIRCGQLLQQDAIDRSKGIISKPMPREWHDRHSVNTIADEEQRLLYRSIVADKKPYFMRYIYPQLMSQYNTYIKNTEKNCLREFGVTVPELKKCSYQDLTERQKEFLRYYDSKMPVGMNRCVMNKICRIFEEHFDGYVSKSSTSSFDYGIMKSDVEYSPKQFREVRTLYENYNKRLRNHMMYIDYERVDEAESRAGRELIKAEFIEECGKVCSDRKVLCNIILDICYTKSSTRRFAWEMCGDEIIENLLSKNDMILRYPTLDDEGDFEYGGNRFSIKERKIEL